MVKSGEEIAAEQQQMQQQELIRSLGSAAVGSLLLDPKKQAEAGLINQEVTAKATKKAKSSKPRDENGRYVAPKSCSQQN